MKPKELAKMYQIQRQLKKEVVEVEAGDGAVTVQITGEQKIKSVKIDPDKVNGDFSKLEKWIESAVTQAITKSQQIATEKMKSIMGGLNIPGM